MPAIKTAKIRNFHIYDRLPLYNSSRHPRSFIAFQSKKLSDFHWESPGIRCAIQSALQVQSARKTLPFQLSMPISYRICTEVSQESDLQADTERYRRNLPKAMQRDEGRNHRSGSMRRSHPYARKYTTIYECSTIRGDTQE